MEIRPGTEFVCQIPDGSRWAVMGDGSIIVTHSDHPPFTMRKDSLGQWQKTVLVPFVAKSVEAR